MIRNIKLGNTVCKGVLVLLLLIGTSRLFAQPDWSVNISAFANNGDITGIVLLDGVEVTQGYLAAFVGTQCRGVDLSPTFFGPSGYNVFQFLVYSNVSSDETMTFKYYNPLDSIEYDVLETVSFVSDMILGTAFVPLEFNAVSNAAPVVDFPIDNQSLPEHFGTHDIDLSSVFSDPDLDALTYSALSSSGSVVDVTVSGTILTIHEVGLGASTITVTASDGLASVDDVFTVNVYNVNDAPVLVNPIADRSPNEGFGIITINLTPVFSDPDGNSMSYSAVSSDVNVVTVSVSGATLTITEVAPGTSDITVTASDGSLSADDVFTVDVNNINDAPIVSNPIDDLPLDEHFGSTTVDLTGVFTDPDEDALTLTPVSSNPTVVTAGISGLTLTINEVGLGSSTITITASDGSLSVQDVFLVSVANVNDAPIVSTPTPNQNENEHFNYVDININTTFSDPDEDDLTITAFSSNTSVVTVQITGNTLRVTEQGVGISTITLTASDGSLSVSDDFTFRVINVNDPPIVSTPIPDFYLDEHFGTEDVNLAGVFTDPDGTTPTLSAISSNTSVVTVSLSGTTLTLTERGIGSSNITVTASDGTYSVQDVFVVNVANVNDPPVVAIPIADQNLSEHFGTRNIGLSSVFSDPDGNQLSFTAVSNNTSVVTVNVSGTTLTLTEAGLGSCTVTVTASDGLLSVQDQFAVNVANVNDAPVVANPIPDQELQEHFGTQTLILTGVFTDPDGNALTLSATSSNTGVVTVSISGTTLTFTERGIGIATITVTASDGSLSVNDQFTAEVVNVNDSPVLEAVIADRTYSEGFLVATINLSPYFSDPDGDALILSASSNNTSVVTVSISGTVLSITERGLGISTITVTASDGSLSVQDDFQVNVNNVNDPPVVVIPIPVQNLPEHFGTHTIGLSSVFSDKDGDVLSYTAVSSNSSVVTVSISGTTLTITERGMGSATVSVTASDGFLSANNSFTVNVYNVNDAPVVINPVAAVNLNEHFGTSTLNVSNVFTDPDNDIMTYTAVSGSPGVVTASVSGTTLTLTEQGLGSATITLTATDNGEGNLSTDHQFTVNVNNVNDPPEVVNAIPDRQVNEHFGTFTINLTPVFSDPDGNTLTYTASSGTPSVVTVSVSGSILTITEAGIGVSNITVTATDNGDGNLFTNDIFIFTVINVNDPPTVANSISDQDLLEHFGTLNIGLANVFNDPDGDELSYSLTSSSPGVVTGAISGTTLTLTETGLGASIITITASDGTYSAEDEFIVSIANVNDPPVVANPVGEVDLNEHFGTTTLNLSTVFSDPDGDNLTITAVSGTPGVVAVSVNGTTLNITEVGLGTSTITLTASDGSLSVNDVFVVEVFNVNDAPEVVNPISNRNLDEYFGSITIGLGTVFSDRDGDALTLSASSSNNSIVTVSISGNILTVTETGLGTATVTVTASDGELSANDEFFVTVNNVNDAPVVDNTIPDQILFEYFGTATVDLSDVFSDKDEDALELTAVSGNTSVVTVSISGTTLTLTEHGLGLSVVTVTASDGSLSVDDQFTVFVNNVNDRPAVQNAISDRVYDEHFGSATINLSNVFSDKDGDELTLTAVSANPSVLTVSVSGSTLNITEVAPGNTTVTVTASDGSLDISDQFNVTINNVNDAPEVADPISNLSLNEYFGSVDLDISGVFEDPDGDNMTYSATSTNTAVVTVSVNGSVLTITEVGMGISNITVTASDGSLSTNELFQVSVDNVNDPPVVENEIIDQLKDEYFTAFNLNIANVFSDPDLGDVITVTAESSDESVVTVSISGSTLTITEAGNGESLITLTATDQGGLTVETSFNFTVLNVNDPPVVSQAIADLVIVNNIGSLQMNLLDYFTDKDGDTLKFSYSLSDNVTADFTLTDTMLSIAPNRVGVVEVIVKGEDEEYSTSDTFNVEVVTEHLLIVQYKADRVQHQDTIVLCNEAGSIKLKVNTPLVWNYTKTGFPWMIMEVQGDTALSIAYSENATGGDRFGKFTLHDTQGHELEIILRQTIDCPNAVESDLFRRLNLYPNPVERILYVNAPEGLRGTIRMEIFDSNGKLLLQKEVKTYESDQMEIDMQDYREGLYFIRISSRDLYFIEKIMKI